ncbi:MAG: shikimate kinase [Bacteroidetes bacterium]|nr:shikimate kinase [Bacteroidota bacterium]
MNKIYVTGLPGSGKTHTGRLLATRLGWDFIDLDAEVAKLAGKPVARIFAEDGETIFREWEQKALHATQADYECVISCGGGTPAWFDNMDWMEKHGLTIFLNPHIDQIVRRLIENPESRPLFPELNEVAVRQKLSEFVENRGEYYSRAKMVWNRDEPNDNFYFAVNQLLSLYSARL